MSYVKGLKCKECGREYPKKPLFVCEFCFGPLEVNYDYGRLKRAISRRRIERGPLSQWRYRDLLPLEGEEIISLGEGLTPLLKADNLARELGLKKLYIKNDTVNPTNSFKDRVVSVAISKAMEFGFKVVACASTGNLANSVAAYAAKARLKSFIFIPADLERGKIIGTSIYNPTLIAVEGNYDEVNRLCSEIAGRHRWAFVNINIRPYYAEGSKTFAYEIAEQLGWRAPDHIIVPVAGGSLISKIYKGLQELHHLGLIPKVRTKISAAQARGCAPVVDAFKGNSDIIKPVKPKTIAKSLAIGNPADGYYALDTIRKSRGFGESVTDYEIIEGMKLLAQTEGIFTETAGGVTVAVTKKLIKQGKIKPDEETIISITGHGLKTQEAVMEALKKPIHIKPTLKSFESYLGK